VAATAPSVAPAYVGTSGFSYPSWRGDFYPPAARPRDFLRLYAERLPSVELNTTFYGLPSEEQFQIWAGETPPEFRFAVKMSGQITHRGALELLATFTERVRALGDRLGPVLVQFPPSRPRDDGLLRLVLDSLDPGLAYAFEFRHESWEGGEVDEVLAAERVARVNAIAGAGPFRYFRLREPPYGDDALAVWAERLRGLLADGVAVHCYFKHEEEPTAPRYARRLLELVSVAGQDRWSK
jgi:uncharacterized protein YecE (DUF72 family)